MRLVRLVRVLRQRNPKVIVRYILFFFSGYYYPKIYFIIRMFNPPFPIRALSLKATLTTLTTLTILILIVRLVRVVRVSTKANTIIPDDGCSSSCTLFQL